MQVQINLVTKDGRFALPQDTLVVPATSTPEDLCCILSKVLNLENASFGFLIENVPWFGTLEGYSTETLLQIEFFEKKEWKEHDPIKEDDWIRVVNAHKELISGSYDCKIRIYQGTDVMQTLVGHTGAITCLCWSDDGILISGSMDKTVRLWDGRQFLSCKSTVQAVSCSSLGTIYAADYEGNIYMTADKIKWKDTWTGHNAAITGLSCKNDLIVSAAMDGAIKIWQDGICIESQASTDAITALDVSPNNNFLLGHASGKMSMGDFRTKDTSSWRLHSGWISSVKDKEMSVLTTGYDGRAIVWDKRSLSKPVYMWCQNGKLLASDWTEMIYFAGQAGLISRVSEKDLPSTSGCFKR